MALRAALPRQRRARVSESWPESALAGVPGTGRERDPAAAPASGRGWFFLSHALPAGKYAGQEATEVKMHEVKDVPVLLMISVSSGIKEHRGVTCNEDYDR